MATVIKSWRTFWTQITLPVNPVLEDQRTWNGVTRNRLSFPSSPVVVAEDNAGIHWGSDPNLLFIFQRQCYDAAAEQLDALPSESVALLQGTPGVGKSPFIPFYIYHRVRRAIALGSNIPSFIIRDIDGDEYHLYMATDGTAAVGIANVTTPCSIFISDTNPRSTAHPGELHLHVASIGDSTDSLKRFKNVLRDQPSGYKCSIYFNPFSFDEYVLCDCASTFTPSDIELLQLKFDIFGGCLRRLRDDCETVTDYVSIVHKHMNWYFGGITSPLPGNQPLLVKYADQIAEIERVIAVELQGIALGVYSDSICLFKHFSNTPNESGETFWGYIDASTFMRYLFGTIHEDVREDNILEVNLRGMFPTAIDEYIFEKRAHDIMFRKLQAGFRTTRIFTNQPAKGGTEQELTADGIFVHKPKLNRKKFLRSVADIAELTEEEYGIPVVPNFPLIDAAVQDNICLQMTVSNTHVGAISQAQNVINQFTSDQVHMIFVLAERNFNSFRYVRPLETAFPGRQHIVFGDGMGASPVRPKKRPYAEAIGQF